MGAQTINTSSYDTIGLTALTMTRDVSDLLELWANPDTPLMNRIAWGPESDGLAIEWITEFLGTGRFLCSGAVDLSGGTALVVAAADASEALCIADGTVLYVNDASDDVDAFLLVSTIGTTTVTFAALGSPTCSIATTDYVYIVGHFVNEGSDPQADTSRPRTVKTNNFSILREDVNITGSQKNTGMYAVGNDMTHQISMRLLELQKNREKSLIFGKTQTRAASSMGLMQGCFGLLESMTGTFGTAVDDATTDLTESAFNAMAAELWDNGGNPNVFVAGQSQIRKFTSWDQARVRTRPDAKLAGHFVTSYLTDTGATIELIPERKFPSNLAFMLDTSKIKLRAKKNRKLIVEELSKNGDYDRIQILSEYSLEMRGYHRGQHGMFTVLN